MKTIGVKEKEIEQFEYTVKDEYVHGVDSHRNDISLLDIRERGHVEYAVILESNLAEILQGKLGENVWYTKSWLVDNPVTIGHFREVNDDKEVIELAKNYIYNHKPKLYSSTLVGYKYDSEFERIVNDPNRMTGYLIIGKNRYKIIKAKMDVTISSKNKELNFTLDKNRYYQSVKRDNFFRELNYLCGKTVGFDERVQLIKEKLSEYDELGNIE